MSKEKEDSIFTLASCLKVGNVFAADGIRRTFFKEGENEGAVS